MEEEEEGGPKKAAKQYDRLLNPFSRATRQDTAAVAAVVWRLKAAVDRADQLDLYSSRRRPRANVLATLLEVESLVLTALLGGSPCFFRKRRSGTELLENISNLVSKIDGWQKRSLQVEDETFHLSPLREAVDQLEDMLDDFEYKQLRVSAEACLRSLIPRLQLIMKRKKMEKLLQNLHAVIKDFHEDLGSSVEGPSDFISPNDDDEPHRSDSIAPEVDQSHISSGSGFGSPYNLKEEVLHKLLDPGGCPVVPYLVYQGLEKATVVAYQDIFDDERVRKKFDLLICIWDSDRSTTAETFEGTTAETSEGTLPESILKLINSSVVSTDSPLTSLSSAEFKRWFSGRGNKESSAIKLFKKESSSDMLQVGNAKELQESIEKEVLNKKFLLVLDDVMEDQLSQLDHLFTALSYGSLGSRIIISSQSSEVLKSVSDIKFLGQGIVQHNIPWHFFRSFSLKDVHPSDYQTLEPIGKDIADHLKQFPLAAKMVGKMLNTNHDYSFWDTISGKVWNLVKKMDCEQHHLLSLLKLCYDQLPAPLSLCFQYCSLFPSDWRFTPESLVQLWMSQGLVLLNEEEAGKKGGSSHSKKGVTKTEGVNYSSEKKTIEDVGRSYFEDLHSRSFFEKFADDGHTSFYILHSFVHCLSQVVAGEEFMRIDNDFHQPDEARHVRHLSIKTTDLSALYDVDAPFRLRTLIVFGPIKSDPSDVLNHVLPRLRIIRTLDLAGCDMKSFPEFHNDLKKHLRYLSLYDTGIEILPDKFCEFLRLQVLNIQGGRLKKLPSKTNRLYNLRHIIGPTLLTSTVHRIGKLNNLQELEEFHVSNKQKIRQLGSITDLRGSIAITNLEKVKCTEADKAKLHDKRKLTSLKLEWSPVLKHKSSICGYDKSRVQILLSAKVLERLRPPSSLLDLEIDGYMGHRSPSWLTAQVLHNVVDIRLTNCMNLVETPPLGHFPFLKALILEKWNSIRVVGREFYTTGEQPTREFSFPKLENLTLEDMPELEVWYDYKQCFPCIQRLLIRKCPNLTELPLFQSSKLTEMIVEEVGLHHLPLLKMQQDSSISASDGFGTSNSLKRLTLQSCPNLSRVGAHDEDNCSFFPSSLLRLLIIDCPQMKNICLKSPVCLQDLHIKQCKDLTVMDVDGVLSLHTVCVDTISLLKPLYEIIISLEVLIIQESALSSLDWLPESLVKTLKKLCLMKCDNVTSLPKNMKNFSSLKSLCLEQCPKLCSLPYLPFNLDELRIEKCPLLEEQCREDGPDWNKISHIPYKSV